MISLKRRYSDITSCSGYFFAEFLAFKQYTNRFFASSFFLFIGFFIQATIINLFFRYGLVKDDDITLVDLLFYIALGGCISHVNGLNRIPEFAANIKPGTFLKYLIRPSDLIVQFNFEELGRSFNYFFETILLCLGVFIVRSYMGGFLFQTIYFLVLFFSAIILSNQISIFFFLIAIRLNEIAGTKALLQGVNGLLSGALVPLVLWPNQIKALIKWSPFALVVDGPIRVFLCLESFYPIFFAQILWTTFFFFLGKSISPHVISKYDATGG